MTSIDRRLTLGRWGLFAVAAITLATLAFQVLLTWTLSATVWYHFAFMAVSVAMFGMTAGALFVHFRAAALDADLRRALVRHSLGTVLAMPLALLVHLAAVRVLVAAATLVPIGVALGIAFPLGLTVAARQAKAALLPWFWAVNGACSVCAAVAASAISFGAGIATTFWVGAACYGLAWLALARATRNSPASALGGGEDGEAGDSLRHGDLDDELVT